MESKSEASIARTLRAEQHKDTEAHHEVGRQTLIISDANGDKLDAAEVNCVQRSSDAELSSDKRTKTSNKHVVRWAIGSNVVTAALTVIFVCLFTWFYGRPIEAAIGLVPVDTVSTKEMQVDHSMRPILEAEVMRLTKENVRLSNRAESQDRKKAQFVETKQALIGLLNDDRGQLEMALRSNRFRKNGFPFAEWSPNLVESAVKLCLSGGNLIALKWIHEQPNWYKIFSEETVDRVNEAVKNGAETDYEKNKRLEKTIEDIAMFSVIIVNQLESEAEGSSRVKLRKIGNYLNNNDPHNWDYRAIQRELKADLPQDEVATKNQTDQ
tara:strand:+ start:2199 stop:3173 length:975 start_codon:yes stop_codon:yes gene_type:complete